LVVLSWGGRYVLSSCESGLLRASSFICMGSLGLERLCVTWLMAVGNGEKKESEDFLVIIVVY